MAADSSIRQKLARCLSSDLPMKTRIQSLKKVFGGIQDPNTKQSAQYKNSLVANDAIAVLISILQCNDPTGPQFDFSQDIFEKGAPDWTAEFVLQADAALALRRLFEIGFCERKSGQKRVHQAVLQGVLEVIIPHLYCTSCAAEYASGALKCIALHEIYRQNICDAGALPALKMLLECDVVEEKSAFRNAAECVHLLSCTTTENFEKNGILNACINIALNNSAGEKPVMLSALCAANITAGRDDEDISEKMNKVYRTVDIGVHLCRWLNGSLNENQKPYFTIKCSQIDMLRSVCFLAASEIGRHQLVSCFIKEDGAQKKLTIVDILAKILAHPATSSNDEGTIETVLEICLHIAFAESGADMIKNCKSLRHHLRKIVNSGEQEDIERNNFSSENIYAAKNILAVVSGGLNQPKVIVETLPKQLKNSGDQKDERKVPESEDNVDSAGNEVEHRESSPQLPHIMVSYSWAQQDCILDICKRLKEAQLPYWLDVEQMHGEINDRMAEAIETCGVVLMGVSSKYKLSANCRMEAEYSNASKKTIIPLLVEKGYRADGWLGLLTAGKLWYAVSSDDEKREENISSLLEAVQSAVNNAASTMPQNVQSRSASLFNANDKSNTQESPALYQTETRDSILEESEVTSQEQVHVSLNSLSEKIMEIISKKLQPVYDSLQNIEKRLDGIENKMSLYEEHAD